MTLSAAAAEAGPDFRWRVGNLVNRQDFVGLRQARRREPPVAFFLQRPRACSRDAIVELVRTLRLSRTGTSRQRTPSSSTRQPRRSYSGRVFGTFCASSRRGSLSPRFEGDEESL